ncbi:hypothetical protein, partial [Sutterella sp. AM11-39]|uniref:hypothetical protein n=1 Tax=Sutterella sp. AM11-39 TaxID=2292075 RepID=UPI001F342B8D
AGVSAQCRTLLVCRMEFKLETADDFHDQGIMPEILYTRQYCLFFLSCGARSALYPLTESSLSSLSVLSFALNSSHFLAAELF